MLPIDRLKEEAEKCGFTHCGPMDVSTVRLHREVREMCEANTCHQYGKTWCCPPGLGSLEECEKRVKACRTGLLVQTVGRLEDAFDYDSMVSAEQRHKKAFDALCAALRPEHPDLLALGAGACTRCEVCTYPDAPCRYPGLACPSMEAFGMLVTEVCRQNDMSYYYGPNTIAYTSCILFA